MPVTKEFLKRMIEEMNLIPMSDEELEIILPKVQSTMDGMEQLSELGPLGSQNCPGLSSRSWSMIEEHLDDGRRAEKPGRVPVRGTEQDYPDNHAHVPGIRRLQRAGATASVLNLTSEGL